MPLSLLGREGCGWRRTRSQETCPAAGTPQRSSRSGGKVAMLDMGLPARRDGWAPLPDRVGRVDPARRRAARPSGPSEAEGALGLSGPSRMDGAPGLLGAEGTAGLPGALGPALLDIPCSMLLRDLAAVCGDGWVPAPSGHVLVA